MSLDEIHVGDIGTILRVTITDDDTAVDISTATTKTIFLKKPDDTKLTKTAVFYSDGSDGIIQYVTIDGDLDAAGWWKIQAYVKMGTNEWYTNWEAFEVHDNL